MKLNKVFFTLSGIGLLIGIASVGPLFLHAAALPLGAVFFIVGMIITLTDLPAKEYDADQRCKLGSPIPETESHEHLVAPRHHAPA